MSCVCDYYDAPEFYASDYRTARKSRKCCECHGPISPGDLYRYTRGKWDGRFDQFHTCERCADLQESLTGLGYCIGHGGLAEDYANYLDDIGSDRNAWEVITNGRHCG